MRKIYIVIAAKHAATAPEIRVCSSKKAAIKLVKEFRNNSYKAYYYDDELITLSMF